MTRRQPVQVAVAAGGLGTRVAGWSALVPKEWAPVDGQPGIVHLLDEIAALGPAEVVVVYHPYYEPLIHWARQALTSTARYWQTAGLPVPPPRWPGLDLRFAAQQGPYSAVTSILNTADQLNPSAGLYVAFADNLYPRANPLLALRASNAVDSVLARPYDPTQAGRRGVIITAGPDDQMIGLVEKPDPPAARWLEHHHGLANLRLLEGRARISPEFLHHLRAARLPDDGEPKFSVELGSYCRRNPVVVVTTDSPVRDLGAPPALDGRPSMVAESGLHVGVGRP